MPYAVLRRTLERFTDTAVSRAEPQSVLRHRVFCLVTWHSGWRVGLVFVLLSFTNQVAIGIVLGHPYSRPTYFLVTNLNKVFSTCLLVAH
jgi:hypothetical protein